MVMRRGYRHGDRLLRPAMVGVTDPAPLSEAEPSTEDRPESDEN
jgi:molecular chaperone GrpE